MPMFVLKGHNSDFRNKEMTTISKPEIYNILTDLFPVIPACMVHPLSEQFNGGLSTIRLQHGHVQVINEEDEVFPYWWSKHTFPSDTQTHASVQSWSQAYCCVINNVKWTLCG